MANPDIPLCDLVSSNWVSHRVPSSPARRRAKRKRRGFTSIQMLHAHTPGRSRVNPKGKRKKKTDTNDGQKAKTTHGGEGNKRTSRTNLHGETDLTSTGYTPKPHDTLQRGTGEELGTEWGLVDDGGETTE